MKALKFLSLLMLGAATLSLGGCRGSQGEEDEPGTGPGTTPSDTEFVVSVDKHFVYNNGTDTATFTATFEGTALSESDVVAYNAATDEVVTLAGLAFSTSAEGTVVNKFYFTYTDAENNLYTSDTFNIVSGTERPIDLSNNGSKGVTIAASIGALQVGVDEAVLFIRRDGAIQNAADVVVCDKSKNDAVVELEGKEYVDLNGNSYTLPYFKSNELGTHLLWAMVGTKNSDYDNPLKVTVIEDEVPKAPADPQPENLNFHRRSLLMQFTGTGCGYCPGMIYAIRQLYLDENVADKFVLAAIHNYGSANDPMQLEKPYSNIGNIMTGAGWPQTITDFYVTNNRPDQEILKATFIQSQSTNGTQAGISVATTYSNGSVVALVRVKANTDNDFRVGAWLVEDDVEAQQANNYANQYPYSEENFNIHEAAVRIADSNRSASNFTSYDLGNLKAGEYGDYLFTMTVKNGWVADNCRLIVFVTSKVDGSYYVTNAIETESLNDIVEIQYAE